jgi:sugar/nucleoside kinase (ribokinase family)
VLDQVSEPECGVITTAVRECLAELAARDPGKVVIVDSRERVGLFRNAWLKPNERECVRAASCGGDLHGALKELAKRANRPVVCTCGSTGILTQTSADAEPTVVPGFPVSGPIDTVGAGDSSSAALACALVSGVNLPTAASFANLVASITIQQIGVTGTATPAQVRARWQQLQAPP